jgi:hypothetical protein
MVKSGTAEKYANERTLLEKPDERLNNDLSTCEWAHQFLTLT